MDVGLPKGFPLVGWFVKGELFPELKDDIDDVPVVLAIIDCLKGFVDGADDTLVVPVANGCCGLGWNDDAEDWGTD